MYFFTLEGMDKLGIFGELTQEFNDFLSNEENERIIFSGRFGIGKTTFLKHFFDGSEEYNAFHIFPVNYAVAKNEDIFSLIKYDIIYLLLVNFGLKFSDYKLSKTGFLPSYIIKKPWKLLLPLLTFKYASAGLKAYDIINKEIEQFLSEYDNSELSESENDVVNSLALTYLNGEGNIYENNYLTWIIQNSLLKLNDEDKKSILIIDDLDRLDPAHIFRLLNVFAAHFDYSDEQKKVYGENKFGFHKIIFVCDIDNIRHLYRHLYGAKIDFKGYIAKFYSSKIYYFGTKSKIASQLDSIIKSRKIWVERNIPYYEQKFSIEGLKFELLKTILIEFYTHGDITLKSLTKYDTKNYIIKSKNRTFAPSMKSFSTGQLSAVEIVEYLILILGSKENLYSLLQEVEDKEIPLENKLFDIFWMSFGVIILIYNHQFINHGEFSLPSSFGYFKGQNSPFSLSLSTSLDEEGQYYLQIHKYPNNKRFKMFSALKRAIDIMDYQGFI